jgi:hypothetical protein
MSRRARPEVESVGRSSFVDIVTNFVGILIILVMVVGERARRVPIAAEKTAAEKAKVIAGEQAAQRLAVDVRRIAVDTQIVQREIAVRSRERAELASLIQLANIDLGRRRDALDVESRARYDLARALALSRAQLGQLQKLRNDISKEQPQAMVVESYPTPISKPVDGKEAHLELRGGRVAWVPLDALLARFKSVAHDKASQLKDEPELTDSVGPIDGFRLRYTLEKVDVPYEMSGSRVHGGGSYVQLSRWDVLPVPGPVGETLDVALSAKSLFRARLDLLSPREWTITIWAYPDSFEEFRKVRKELYHLGYAIAGRPLPEGTPIGGSPKGSKSAAE